jgi:hypothetical protein
VACGELEKEGRKHSTQLTYIEQKI